MLTARVQTIIPSIKAKRKLAKNNHPCVGLDRAQTLCPSCDAQLGGVRADATGGMIFRLLTDKCTLPKGKISHGLLIS